MYFDRFLEMVARSHFPNPPASPRQIEAFETRVGWKLDDELRAFYLRFNGAALFKRPDSPYRLLSLSEIVRARVALFGPSGDTDAHGPASWFVLCSVQDGDYVAIDVGRSSNGRHPLFDCVHELLPGSPANARIAWSFSDFLERALESEGRLYWLSRGWTLGKPDTP
ncbi:SMI1/KNR4 family protein [Archangium violaceum]|uniref:SMI1/KNR4 family protein n=1 Tax=Archangium violaceum TaxID=83451 RepID=UPI0019526D63|nr:SMI1/KNR4 family protein [Archangium violaceum]QRN97382.1 SMI1/KNR4 family protein [Archangium violaceum]